MSVVIGGITIFQWGGDAPENPRGTLQFTSRANVNGEDSKKIGYKGRQKQAALMQPCNSGLVRNVLFDQMADKIGSVVPITKSDGTVYPNQMIVDVIRGPDVNNLATLDGQPYELHMTLLFKGVV